MKATHKVSPPPEAKINKELIEVVAWEYRPGIPMPVWVARQFHHIGGKKDQLSGGTKAEFATAMPDDWIVIDPNGEGQAHVLPPEIFAAHFAPIA